MKGPDWRVRAACSRLDPDIFYPVGNGAYACEMTEKKIMPRASALGFAAGTHKALTEGGDPR